jgi:hypothetical protein
MEAEGAAGAGGDEGGSSSRSSSSGGGSGSGSVSGSGSGPAATAAAAASSPAPLSSLFRLTVPLSDVVGMDIVVEVDVSVDVDDAAEAASSAGAISNGKWGVFDKWGGGGNRGRGGGGGGGGVSFRADRLRLSGSALEPGGPGRALSRAEVDLRLEARLSSPPDDARGGGGAVAAWRARVGGGGSGVGQMTTAAVTVALTEAASASGALADAGPPARTRRLCLEADAAVSLRVPPPLSSAPAALLGATGSLVARLAMRALLPPFLDLLAADYRRWAAEKMQQGQLGAPGAGALLGAGALGAGAPAAGGGGGRAAALDEAVGSLML